MAEVCNTSAAAVARELSGAEPDLAAAAALDLSGCDRLELSVGLFEHEKAGLRFESWPPEVQRRVEKMLTDWQAANPARALRALTTSVSKVACVMVIHHAPKG